MDHYEHFKNQEGSDIPIFRGHPGQKGHGLGNWFKSFFRFVVPLIKKHAVPVLKKGATIIGTEAIKTASNIATDKIAGKKFEDASRERFHEGLENIHSNWKSQKGSGELSENEHLVQEGSGVKRKLKRRRISVNKKQKKLRRLKDIFDV
jgi:hypothetical protein